MNDEATKAIILKDNKVLILKQVVDNQTFYALPGGRIQSENYKTELIREVKEETNLDIIVENYVTDWSFTRKDWNTTKCKIYICKYLTSNLTSQNSEKEEDIQELLWLTADEINSENILMSNDLKKIITDILNT